MTKPEPGQLLLPRRKERIDRVVAARTNTFTLVLDRVGDPHNISAVMRTCEGFGVQELHVVVDPDCGYRANPKITQGAEKWVDTHLHAGIAEPLRVLKERGFRIYVSDFGEGAVPLHEVPLEDKVALVLGNEAEGVSQEALSLADRRFVIPMLGFAQSYNVSVTAAVCVALMRERRRARGVVGDLPAEQAEALRHRFYELAVHQGGRIFRED